MTKNKRFIIKKDGFKKYTVSDKLNQFALPITNKKSPHMKDLKSRRNPTIAKRIAHKRTGFSVTGAAVTKDMLLICKTESS